MHSFSAFSLYIYFKGLSEHTEEIGTGFRCNKGVGFLTYLCVVLVRF